jgi:hypothetical protein
MEIKRYTELKNNKNVRVKKYGSKKGIEVTEFDPSTGEPQPPVFQELDIEQLRGNAALNRAAALQIEELIKDLEDIDHA